MTVHVAVGTDIIHMHPSANGAAIGQATFNDFRILSAVVAGLTGGVYLNVGNSSDRNPKSLVSVFRGIFCASRSDLCGGGAYNCYCCCYCDSITRAATTRCTAHLL